MLTFLCAAFARIRCLRKSPQYGLVILQRKMAVSTTLRNYAQNVHNNCSDQQSHRGWRNSLGAYVTNIRYTLHSLSIVNCPCLEIRYLGIYVCGQNRLPHTSLHVHIDYDIMTCQLYGMCYRMTPCRTSISFYVS